MLWILRGNVSLRSTENTVICQVEQNCENEVVNIFLSVNFNVMCAQKIRVPKTSVLVEK